MLNTFDLDKAVAMLNAYDVLEVLRGDEHTFLSVMCMMFDEFAARHDDFQPAEAAQKVADMVKQVNAALGRYDNIVD